jgi:ATP-dependent protease HslVU (ClpYQ) peptidase subunit
MTTIAFKDGILAADSQETHGEMPVFCRKIYRHNHGWMAVAGESMPALVMTAWWQAGHKDEEKPEFADDASFVCLIHDGGQLFVIDRDCVALRILLEDPRFFAIGTGADLAMGAMAAGAGAAEAVRLACKLDINSGLPVAEVNCNEGR